MPRITLTVNRQLASVEVEALRDKLGLSGIHVGCNTSQCGCCVVQIDGKSVKSCTFLAVQANGASVTTIEGLNAQDRTMHPMQEMFRTHHALQCGFGTPGMMMSAINLIQAHPYSPRRRSAMAWRTISAAATGYHNIVKAIEAAWSLMRDGAAAQATQ